MSKYIHSKIPQAQLIILPNIGHVSNLESPFEFNKIVTDFLGKQLI